MRQSCASLSSLISVWGSTTPTTFPAGSGKRQKGMAGMIRASRRFTTQSSVICQNGDVIIVKGGKIVSIRREETVKGVGGEEGKGVAAPPEGGGAVKEDALWGAATPSLVPAPATPNFPLEGDTRGVTTTFPPPAPAARWGSVSSEGSDEVFGGSDGAESCSDLLTGSLLDIIAGDTQRLLSADTDPHHLTADQPDVTLPPCCPQWADRGCAGRGQGGVLISLDEVHSVLQVTPLSPLTRQGITRSAVELSREGRGWGSAGSTPSQASPSAARGPRQRLPELKAGHLSLSLKKRSSSEVDVRTSGGSQRLEPFV